MSLWHYNLPSTTIHIYRAYKLLIVTFICYFHGANILIWVIEMYSYDDDYYLIYSCISYCVVVLKRVNIVDNVL